jgi:hypothetical protein
VVESTVAVSSAPLPSMDLWLRKFSIHRTLRLWRYSHRWLLDGTQFKAEEMTDYANTVKDVSRAVAELNDVENYDTSTSWEKVRQVAGELGWQFSRHITFGDAAKVTVRDVRFALMAHGASKRAVALHTVNIARLVRRHSGMMESDYR